MHKDLIPSIISLLIGTHGGDFCGENARDVLLKSFESRTSISGMLIQIRRGSEQEREWVQTKLQLSGDGKSRRTVLQPLRMQGVISIDDGQNWVTIQPDERTMTIQVSPMVRRANSKHRMSLIDQNYLLRFDKAGSVAGRKAHVVVASPRSKEMRARRFTIDLDSYLILRQETQSSVGKWSMQFDTQALSLSERQDPSLFRRPSSKGYVVTVCDSPAKIFDLERAADRVGFDPRNPDSLPFGFEILEWDLLSSEGSPFLGARLSDGLSSVTVYQWNSRKPSKDLPFSGHGELKDSSGVCYLLFGDVPKAVRTSLLESFRKAAKAP